MEATLLEHPETGYNSGYEMSDSDGQLDDQRRRVLAELLRDWRQREALNQMDAARALGVSYRAYQQYENAQVLPHGRTERRLVEGIGMSWDEYRDRIFEPMLEDRVTQLREEMAEEMAALRKEIARLRPPRRKRGN